MNQHRLWKYFTPAHHREFVLSLQLLGDTDRTAEQQLRCLYAVARHTERHYTRFLIPRRVGPPRAIQAPDPLLREIQRNLLHGVLGKLPVSPHATAYRLGMGVRDHALPHLGQRMVLRLDICDFFGSVSYLMVYRALPRAVYPPSVATLLAHLCCCEDCLPQGAPTSPAVSNLVLRPFDDYMGEWCARQGVAYTRYCDDMTFSGDFDPAAVTAKAGSFLLSLGFALNRRKTQAMGAGQRQLVTGLVVNQKLQVSRSYRRALRQQLHYCRRFGPAAHLQRLSGLPGPPEPAAVTACLRSLLGKVGYVLQADPQNAEFAAARRELLEWLRQ